MYEAGKMNKFHHDCFLWHHLCRPRQPEPYLFKVKTSLGKSLGKPKPVLCFMDCAHSSPLVLTCGDINYIIIDLNALFASLSIQQGDVNDWSAS